jgi:cyclopropane-fatty-acyl-phospholipid synthase
MSSIDSPLAHAGRRAPPPVAARLVLSLLERLEVGRLTLTSPDGTTRRFGPGGVLRSASDLPREADLRLHNWSVFRKVLVGSDVAFAEAYMDGAWDTSDLVALLTIVAFNQRALEHAFYGRRWQQAVFRLRHLLRSNSRRRARRNIVAHYDLGNDFYRLWLDPTMTYSAALFGADTTRPLEDAQQAKYARVLRELGAAPGAHLLELGCGWGGFAETAARAGYRITGVSLSDAQTAYARDRVARAGLAERADLRILDYRDVRDRYDGVASIEMFEAVGERYWPAYFRTVRQALNPGARACIQTITIADERFERYRQNSDFIQQHIFPGGMLCSPSRFVAEANAAGLEVDAVHRFGHDYAETLKRWLAAFDANVEEIRAQGFDDRFIRCWKFYLAYCAAGFASETTDVAHYTLRAT